MVTATVEQDDRLPASREVFMQRLVKRTADSGCVAGFNLVIHIYNFDIRQLGLSISCRKTVQLIFIV